MFYYHAGNLNYFLSESPFQVQQVQLKGAVLHTAADKFFSRGTRHWRREIKIISRTFPFSSARELANFRDVVNETKASKLTGVDSSSLIL